MSGCNSSGIEKAGRRLEVPAGIVAVTGSEEVGVVIAEILVVGGEENKEHLSYDH